jgi:hypothetical protein
VVPALRRRELRGSSWLDNVSVPVEDVADKRSVFIPRHKSTVSTALIVGEKYRVL